MSFLADICKCAREQARLQLDSMAVAVPGGGGGIRAVPPQRPITRDQHIFCPPKPPKPGLLVLDPLGPLAEVDFFIRFQGLAGRIGPRGKNQGSAERTRAPRDGPARRIRAPQDRSGPVGRIRAPQDKSRPVRQIKALRDKPETTEQIRASQYESGPAGRIRALIRVRITNQDPARRMRAPRDKQGPARRMRAGRRK